MTRTRPLLLALALCAATAPAHAGKGCDDLRAAIDAKIQAKGVRGYSLDIVGAADVGSAKVVGSCDGNRKRIVYARGSGGMSAAAPAAQNKPASATKRPPAKTPPALGNY